jgi:hypothetical protein
MEFGLIEKYETYKFTKLRMKMGVQEIIVRKVKCFWMNTIVKSIIRMNFFKFYRTIHISLSFN